MDKKTEILKQYWGFDSFRPLQDEIIDSVLDNKDTLALMPTGGGKSLCFQVPALVNEGVCIVVSPLIALMKDQVRNLTKRGIKASAIFSGMHYKDIDRILDNAVYGDTKLLYISPERLTTDLFRERLRKMDVNLLAIDESHCISQWGYDFRPPYLQIADIRKIIPNAPVLAVTATATPEVVVDIQEKLDFKEENIFQKSFSRDNLSYSVLYENNKSAKMLDILKRVKGSTVIYVRNRRRTKDIAVYLRKKGISAEFYHGGLKQDERNKKQ
ncbi:MAG: RecQ family ATP-dependent DNA helicase, partial [Saprospiraceae bacterium]